ncbi:MAG: phage terminase large subunit family protein [Oscillospiraceae bacterium]|nr:phage terminase large subunit family protein [Oscillospiraceae bacterium]
MDRVSVNRINHSLSKVLETFRPEDKPPLREWAKKYRQMSRSVSATGGKWDESHAPWAIPIMEAFADDNVHVISAMMPAQMGKSEILLNIIGWTIDINPCGILLVQPTDEDVKSFSKLRVAPLIADNKRLRAKVRESKSRDSGNTVKVKQFPGGFLRMASALSYTNIRSTPCGVVLVDELSGCKDTVEGKLQTLIERRTDTYPNAKIFYDATPTIKGACKIESEFLKGTQGHWRHRCKDCGAFVEALFTRERLRYNMRTQRSHGKEQYEISDVVFVCPECGCASTEQEVKSAEQWYLFENTDAYKSGRVSFCVSGLYNRSRTWESIIVEFQESKENAGDLMAFKNTVLGELWEARSGDVSEEKLLERREDYGLTPDGNPADMPNGVLALTCGVDVQGDRLELEVLGHGWDGETWGVLYRVIQHPPETDAAWNALDDILEREFFRQDGRSLRITRTCVDTGYKAKTIVYRRCWERRAKRVIAIKGVSSEGARYVPTPEKVTKQAVKDEKGLFVVRLFPIGVDEGKHNIFTDLDIGIQGRHFCHFPENPEAGYDGRYFHGLVSEDFLPVKTSSGIKYKWMIRNGHERNEPLDCRNYALVACRIENPDWQSREREIRSSRPGQTHPKKKTELTRREQGLNRYEQNAQSSEEMLERAYDFAGKEW